MHSNQIILTCCGETVETVGAEPVECPACSTHFPEVDVERLQREQITKIPVVDLHRAQDMLGRPAEWINERRLSRELEPVYYGKLRLDFVIPITAIRRLANKYNLPVKPRPISAGSLLWIDRPTTG